MYEYVVPISGVAVRSGYHTASHGPSLAGLLYYGRCAYGRLCCAVPPPASRGQPAFEYSRMHVAALWQYCRVPFTRSAYLLNKPALPVRLVGSAAVLGVPPRQWREPVRPQYYSALSVLRKYSLPKYSPTGVLQYSRCSPALPVHLFGLRPRPCALSDAVLRLLRQGCRLCGPHAADRCLRLMRTSRIYACVAHDHRPSRRTKASRRRARLSTGVCKDPKR